jgi:hypothetical protein
MEPGATHRRVTSNRPDVMQKETYNKLKYKSLRIEIQQMRDIKCMIIPVTIGATGMVRKGLKKIRSHTRKPFNRFTTKDSCTWNIAHNTESTAVGNLKPERWGPRLVQEKYQG